MQNFKDKVAVITGGAGGFGREFARIGAQRRMEEIVSQTNPSDPFAATPHIRDMLRARMKSA